MFLFQIMATDSQVEMLYCSVNKCIYLVWKWAALASLIKYTEMVQGFKCHVHKMRDFMWILCVYMASYS